MNREDMRRLIRGLDAASDGTSGLSFRLLVFLREALLGMDREGFLGRLPGKKLEELGYACGAAAGKADLQALLSVFRKLLTALEAGGTPGVEKGTRQEARDAVRYMTCVLRLYRDGRRLAGQAEEEDTESDWEDGERRLREKLEQLLLLYEVTARTGIQTRARKEMEALRAVTDRGCEPEELQETHARLLEEETMLLEKTGEMKKSLRSGRTMDARDGYEGWKLQGTGKEENDATICRLEEPEPESGD